MDEADLSEAERCRRAANRLGFALQLCWLPKARIARQLGIGRASVYRLLTAGAITPATPVGSSLP